MNKIFKIITGYLEENCYLLCNTANECLIIDPGDDFTKIKNKIASENLFPKAILITHGHYDHTDAVAMVKNEYNIPAYMNLEDEFFVEGKFVVDYDADKASELDGFNIKVYNTPGHSKGSVCYLEGDNLFTGDTLFMGTIGRWDFEGGSYDEITKSLNIILNEFDDDIKIFPGHGNDTTMVVEKNSNPYLCKLKK